MPPPPTMPEHVYKIVPSAPPAPLPTPYPLSELDRKDGFVHLSTAKQVPLTANLFFGEDTTLWIIKIRFARFEKDTTWEVPDSDGCPHLHGNFGAQDVDGVQVFERGKGEDWRQVMLGSSFLS